MFQGLIILANKHSAKNYHYEKNNSFPDYRTFIYQNITNDYCWQLYARWY